MHYLQLIPGTLQFLSSVVIMYLDSGRVRIVLITVSFQALQPEPADLLMCSAADRQGGLFSGHLFANPRYTCLFRKQLQP